MSPEDPVDPVDDGWDEPGEDGGADEGPDDAPADAAADAAPGAAGAPGEGPRKRRRRRRRRRDHGDQQAQGQPHGGHPQQGQPHGGQSQPGQPHGGQPQPGQPRGGQPQPGQPHGGQPQPGQPRGGQPHGGQPRQSQQQQPQRAPQQQQPRSPHEQRQQQTQHPRDQRHDQRRDNRDQSQQARDQRRDNRDDRGRNRRRDRDRRSNDPRETSGAVETSGEHDLRDDDDVLRGDPYRTRDDDATGARGSQPSLADSPRGSQPRLEDRGRPSQPPPLDDEEHAPEAPAVAWGSEDDSAPPTITLAPDLPVDAPSSDPDPLTYPLVDGPGAQLGDDVASVVGVRFVPAGRIQWCDAGDGDFAPGERVLVDSDRGQRLGWIATTPTRRPMRDRNLRRVIRRANDMDLRGERDGEGDRTAALRIAKDVAAQLRLPLKVFRVEKTGGKINVYYTSDERLDLRDFVQKVGQATNARLELRQLGVRDEAKAVGGIGSCGLTLCCTTWLPEFVPVSIKMAKDQGLVLSPTKVSGQCGRLKCCLVYEQAGYAELRKGLPKLGKRVISQRGEGRVVEVDVLRQRVRVSYGHGDTEVLPATEVKPMFPSGNQPREPEPPDEPDEPGLPDS